MAPGNTAFYWKSLLSTHSLKAKKQGQGCSEAVPIEKQPSQLSPRGVNVQEQKFMWHSPGLSFLGEPSVSVEMVPMLPGLLWTVRDGMKNAVPFLEQKLLGERAWNCFCVHERGRRIQRDGITVLLIQRKQNIGSYGDSSSRTRRLDLDDIYFFSSWNCATTRGHT